ncbi:alpha-2-HS-glycoprotein, isoform CRA_f [Mus musculus]|nr:alpha-2-HS-glycoprotein, isoform CRA_f [Mus musculus]
MKSLVLLLCFAQLWGCQSAPQGTGLGFRELACDDPEQYHITARIPGLFIPQRTGAER